MTLGLVASARAESIEETLCLLFRRALPLPEPGKPAGIIPLLESRPEKLSATEIKLEAPRSKLETSWRESETTCTKLGMKGFKLAPSRTKPVEPHAKLAARPGKLEATRVELTAGLLKPESNRIKLESWHRKPGRFAASLRCREVC